MENKNEFIYTEEQLMARLKFFIGICLSLTLFGIVFVVLYSLIFVTQPLNAISPIDQKFFELIVPIATFLTGTLSGIMLAGGDKDAQKAALQAANKGWDKPASTPLTTTTTMTRSTTGMMPSSQPFGMAQSSFETTSGFNGTAATDFNNFGAPVVGFGGKLAPPAAPQPEI